MKEKCPKCKNTNTVKRGLSPTQHRGKQQRYLCKDCGKTFIPDKGFWKMKTPEKLVTKAIDLYFSNLSSRKVRNQYRRHEDLTRSHITVLDWCRKYTLKVQKYIDTLSPRIGGKCYADETEIDCKGIKHRFWVSVDWDTRYLNATHYSIQGSIEEAITFLKKAKKTSPRYIQTDAAQFYPKAMRKVFWSNKVKDLLVAHRVNNVSKTKRHNVRIETVFSKIKDRVTDFRGLKALWSAPILLNGIVIQHNFIESHTTTGAVPCALAGIDTVNNRDRWLSIIGRSCT